MAARLHFAVRVRDTIREDLSVRIKQIVGTKFDEPGFEVSIPDDLKIPIPAHVLRAMAEDYYREALARSLAMFGGAAGVTMMANNRLHIEATFETDAIEGEDAGW